MVGDASQTIYSFTGATPDHLLNFRTRHPNATVVKLVRDYRSTPQVVHLANGLLTQAQGRAAEHRLELVSQREAGPEPVYTEYADEPAEAEGTARRIRDLIAAGVPAGEIAVLFRINAQSEVYEQALADVGVPYQLRGAERFFERPEVREAGVKLRGAARFGGQRRAARRRRGPAVRGAGGAQRHGLDQPAAGRLRGGPRPLGVAGGSGAARRGLRRGPARGHPRRPRRRAGRAGQRPARPDGRRA